jgi:hypothetical protein
MAIQPSVETQIESNPRKFGISEPTKLLTRIKGEPPMNSGKGRPCEHSDYLKAAACFASCIFVYARQKRQLDHFIIFSLQRDNKDV